MAKKKGAKKLKKSKEELEAERAAIAETARLEAIEKEKRAAEESELERQRLEEERIELERLRGEEIARLQEEFSQTRALAVRRRKNRAHVLYERLEDEEWRTYLECRKTPERSSTANLNAYLREILQEDVTDFESMLTQCRELEIILNSLKVSVTSDMAERKDVNTWDNVRKVFTAELLTVDCLSSHLLRKAEELMSPKQEVLLGKESDSMFFGLWINLASKGLRARSVEFPESSISIDVPKIIATQNVALRVLRFSRDAISLARLKGANFDVGLGDVYFFETLKMPTDDKVLKDWVLRAINPALENGVQRLNFNASAEDTIGSPGGSTDSNNQISLTVSVRVAQNIIIRDIKGKEIAEDAAECVELRVGAWDTCTKAWTEKGISDVSFDPSTRRLTFTTVQFSAHTLLKRKWADFPFVSWALSPIYHVRDSIPASEEHDSEKGTDLDLEVDGKPLNVVGVLLTLRTPLLILNVELIGEERGCRLQEPYPPELSSLAEGKLSPAEFFTELSDRGIDLRASASFDERLTMKESCLEDFFYEEISAAASSAFCFQSSRWNQALGSDKCCVAIWENPQVSADLFDPAELVARAEFQMEDTSENMQEEKEAPKDEDKADSEERQEETKTTEEEGEGKEDIQEEEKDTEQEATAMEKEEISEEEKKKLAKKEKKRLAKLKKQEEERKRAEAEAEAERLRLIEEAERAAREAPPKPDEQRVILFQKDEAVQETGIKCAFLQMRENDKRYDEDEVLAKDQTTHVYLENALLAQEIYSISKIHNMQDDPSSIGLRETIFTVLRILRPASFTV